MADPLRLDELGNTYVSNRDRFVVSLIVGYEASPDIQTAQDALRHALDLTRDGESWDTHWYVFDRHTGTLHLLEQKLGEPDYEGEEDD